MLKSLFVHLSFAKKRTPFGLQLTATLAAFLIAALGIFAASPVLHAWLHAHEHLTEHPAAAKIHSGSQPNQTSSKDADDGDDDGCVIRLFAQGILGAFVFFLLQFGFSRAREVIYPVSKIGIYRAPRYWLPPLCGPPRSA